MTSLFPRYIFNISNSNAHPTFCFGSCCCFSSVFLHIYCIYTIYTMCTYTRPQSRPSSIIRRISMTYFLRVLSFQFELLYFWFNLKIIINYTVDEIMFCEGLCDSVLMILRRYLYFGFETCNQSTVKLVSWAMTYSWLHYTYSLLLTNLSVIDFQGVHDNVNRMQLEVHCRFACFLFSVGGYI